jgi:hypothetical protein
MGGAVHSEHAPRVPEHERPEGLYGRRRGHVSKPLPTQGDAGSEPVPICDVLRDLEVVDPVSQALVARAGIKARLLDGEESEKKQGDHIAGESPRFHRDHST